MNKDFILHPEALALRELGFNEPCFGYYLDNKFQFFADVRSCNTNSEFKFYPTALTFSQAFRWFREKYGYDISIKKGTMKSYKFEIQKLVYEGDDYFFNDFSFSTYEKAELACLIKLIEIVKNK
jgi:hypothetical protein